MSKGMRSRCQRECDADVIIMRSRCQGECEADVKSNAKPMSHRARSRCGEGTHTRTRARRREVQTHTNKLTLRSRCQNEALHRFRSFESVPVIFVMTPFLKYFRHGAEQNFAFPLLPSTGLQPKQGGPIQNAKPILHRFGSF